MSTHLLKIKLVLLVSCIVSSLLTYGQTQIDLNATQQTLREKTPIISNSKALPEYTIAKRAFQLNAKLQKVGDINKGDRITLSLFENKNYQAIIDRVETDINKSVIISASLPDYPLGYVIISTTALGKSLVTVEIPELDEHYKSISDVNGDTSYLVQFDDSEHDHAVCGGAVIADNTKEVDVEGKYRIGDALSTCSVPVFGSNPSTNATIRILVLYTADAATWSNNNAGGIANTIASGLATIQNAWNTSQIGATIELAHSAQVNYSEVDNLSTDLSRLQAITDGFIDNAEELRKTYSADLVTLIVRPNSGNTAGIAYLLTEKTGRYEYGYSVIMVNYFNSLTTPHEIGHNMGMNHDASNASVPVPITPYAYGWRWYGTNSVQYRSIMAYAPGSRVNYFSNPSTSYQGTVVGNAATADNKRLAIEIKHVIADYKHQLTHIPERATNLIVHSTHDHGANISWTPVAGASGYQVSYLYNGNWWIYQAITSTSFSINYPTHFQPGVTYRWRVETLGSCPTVRSVSAESTFTTTGNPLPVSLINFEGGVNEYAIKLTWTTSTERNSSYYQVQRSSNGQDWNTLGEVTAAGNSKEVQKYDLTDQSPSSKQNYYRLKVVDKDQTFEYSKIISVDMPNLPLMVYPNPANVELEIKGLTTDVVESIELMNQAGQVILHKGDVRTNKLSVKQVPVGTYILRVNYIDNSKTTRKVLITR